MRKSFLFCAYMACRVFFKKAFQLARGREKERKRYIERKHEKRKEREREKERMREKRKEREREGETERRKGKRE